MKKRTILSIFLSGLLVSGNIQANEESVTINWARWDVHNGPEFTAIADAYMKKNPNVTIKSIDLGSADYNSMLLTQLSGGAKNLDVVTVKDSPGYTSLIRSNAVTEVTGLISEELTSNVNSSNIINELTVDGKIYALPMRLDFWVVYYNKQLFDNANVDYPTNDMSLAEFDEITRKVSTGFGANKIYGALYHIWRSTVQLPALFDGKHSMITSDYSFLKPYYERMLSLQNDRAIPKYASLKATNTHYSGPWFNASVAMMPMGSWFIATQIEKAATGESKAADWGIVKMPHPPGVKPGTTAATVTALAINVNSDNRSVAEDFVKFAAGEEGAIAVAKAGGFPAYQTAEITRISASREGFPADQQSIDALQIEKTYLEMPIHPATPRIETILNRTHDAIMTESETIDDAIKLLNEDVAKILAE